MWETIIIAIVQTLVWLIMGAILSYFLVWLRRRYADNECMSAAINYLAAGIAETSTTFARALKMSRPNHKFTELDIQKIEARAIEKSAEIAKMYNDKRAMQRIENWSPAEASAMIKEIITKRFGGKVD